MLPGSEVGKSEVPSRKLKKISWWNKGCPKGFFGKNCKRNVTAPTAAVAAGCAVPVCVHQGAVGGFVI
ncbi:Neurogenic Locus Notch Protein 3 [Manis pentadactyla]|nr:Neurogenic Locus Notch Protein 3 [Manis pentadactyla]